MKACLSLLERISFKPGYVSDTLPYSSPLISYLGIPVVISSLGLIRIEGALLSWFFFTVLGKPIVDILDLTSTKRRAYPKAST